MSSTLLQLASSVVNYEQYWMNIIKKGQEDGSISNDYSYDVLVHMILMAIYGFTDQFKKKKYHLKQHELTREKVKELVNDIINSYLKQK